MNEIAQNGEPVAMEGQETEGEDKGDNEDDRKLFVGGLSWETTAKDLKDYFGKYGEVTTCTLKTDMDTRRSRGFGFVVFTTVEAVDKALEEKEHKLHGRTIDPKRANPRVKEEIKKIFVGKLDQSTPESDVKEYFSKFGKVEKVELPYDRNKQLRRAFCFVEFEEEETVNKVLLEKHTLGGVELDVKKASPANQSQRGRGGRGGWGFGGGRGGRSGRGGWGGGWNQGYGDAYFGYGQGYGGYGGYSGYGGYPDYYGYQGYGSWPGYDQGYGYGGYGYDYGGWYGPEQGQQPSSYGKTPKRGGGGGGGGSSGGSGGNYHPYSR